MNAKKAALVIAGAVTLFAAGLVVGANKFNQPKTLVHVVTIQWNDDTTDQQKQAVYDGVKKMAGEIPGIRSVWTKPIKVQGQGYNGAFVMEFENKDALDAYAKAPAHADWMKVYGPAHKESTTHDITN